jgi:hypothetical protein
VGHSQTLRFSLLQFCSVGVTSPYRNIDSGPSLQGIKECINQVEQIDAKINSKKKELTSLFQEPALIIIHFQHAKLVSLVLSNFRFLPHLQQ